MEYSKKKNASSYEGYPLDIVGFEDARGEPAGEHQTLNPRAMGYWPAHRFPRNCNS